MSRCNNCPSTHHQLDKCIHHIVDSLSIRGFGRSTLTAAGLDLYS
ncbi:hypothetical protein H4I95_00196 [Botrytis cinerea]